MIEQPVRFLEHVQTFLGLEPLALSAEGPVVANPWGDRMARVHMKETVKRVGSTPILGSAIRLFPHGLRRRVRALLLE